MDKRINFKRRYLIKSAAALSIVGVAATTTKKLPLAFSDKRTSSIHTIPERNNEYVIINNWVLLASDMDSGV